MSAALGAALSFSFERVYEITSAIVQGRRADSRWIRDVVAAVTTKSPLTANERRRLQDWLAQEKSWERLLAQQPDSTDLVGALSEIVFEAHRPEPNIALGDAVAQKREAASNLLNNLCQAIFEATDSATALAAVASTLSRRENATLQTNVQMLLDSSTNVSRSLEDHQIELLQTLAKTFRSQELWKAIEPAALPLQSVAAPSMLLRPRFRVVPWVGGHPLLEQLDDWTQSPNQVAILTGGGGTGKTRTAVELCSRAVERGMVGGLLRANSKPSREVVNSHALLIVDYAETRVAQTQQWLAACGETLGAKAKMLLLVRQRSASSPYLDIHRFLGASDSADSLLGTAKSFSFDDISWRREDLYQLGISSGDEFAEMLGLPRRPTDFEGTDPFAVSLHSLENVLGETEPIDLLTHERRYLHQSAAQALDPFPIGAPEVDECILLATILATVDTGFLKEELALLPAIKGLPEFVYLRIVQWLAQEYHSPEGIGVLAPDRLAEQFATLVLQRSPSTLDYYIGHHSTYVVQRITTILSRAQENADGDSSQ